MSKNKKRLSKVAAVLTERAVPNNIIQRLASIVALANYYQLELEIRKQLLHYPSSAILFKMLALSLNLQGKDALDPALRAAELAPNDPQVFNNLGNAYIRLGLYPEAIAAFSNALRIEPNDPEVNFNLGNAYFSHNEFNCAIDCYSNAIKYHSQYLDAYNNQASAFRAIGDMDSAIASYQAALMISPDYALANSNIGILYNELKMYQTAKSYLLHALVLEPDDVDARYNLGISYAGLGEYAEAENTYQCVLKLNAKHVYAANNLAYLYRDLGRAIDAERFFLLALECQPDYFEAHNGLGIIYREMGRLEQARAVFTAALENHPESADLYANLANVFKDMGLIHLAVTHLMQALLIRPQDYDLRSSLIMTLGYHYHGIDPMVYVSEAKFFAELAQNVNQYTSYSADVNKERKLTIGFVSGDFRVHPVGYFVESIIREFAVIAENEFELVVYSNHLQQDQITESIRRAVKHFNQVTALSDCQLATKIHDDQVDILIDLSGHTAFNRLPMFAYQAAPIQISWLGCMLTTGLSTMNYYLTDRWMVPAEFEHEYTEKIVRLPDSFLCFTPPKEDIPCSFLPLSKNGYVTFGCFNNLTKINQNVIALWAKILLALPASRLMLKSRQLGEQQVCTDLIAQFEQLGVTADRLILRSASNRIDYLKTYQEIDIALDPFPLVGGTTTVESLWMGVPVLTLSGATVMSHQGESILRTAGLDDWVAFTQNEYFSRAVAFASDLDGLVMLRAHLRQKIVDSPLCDAPRFAQNLQQVLRSLWQVWCSK